MSLYDWDDSEYDLDDECKDKSYNGNDLTMVTIMLMLISMLLVMGPCWGNGGQSRTHGGK